jgi:hypothetical protein
MGRRTLVLALAFAITPVLPACNGDDGRVAPAPQAIPAAREPAPILPTGTTFVVRVNEELTTERSRPGDPFTATLMGPLVDADGAELVPSGATVRGRVTAVSPPGPADGRAALTLAFEVMTFGWRSRPMRGVIEEVVGRGDELSPRVAAAGVEAGTVVPVDVTAGAGRLPRGARLSVRLIEPVDLAPAFGEDR